MNRPANTPRIVLVVLNPQRLRQGCAPLYNFDAAGGTIGSQGADWLLSDNRQHIHPIHCQVVLDEGLFCVVDRSGLTRLNGSDAALGLHVSARLSEGDTLHIGPYRVSVHLHDQQHALPDPSRHLIQYEVGELLNLQDERSSLFEQMAYEPAPDNTSNAEKDLLQAWLQDATSHDNELDPLLRLSAEQTQKAEHSYSLIDDTHHGMSIAGTQPNLAATRFEAISGMPNAQVSEPVWYWQPTAESSSAEPLTAAQPEVFEHAQAATATCDAPPLSISAAPTPQLDAELAYAITQGLNALLHQPASSSELDRFWNAFNQHYLSVQRTQGMPAQ